MKSSEKKPSALSVLLHPGRSGNDTATDWHNASSESVLRLIETVTSRNGAIRFGYTRDGGAYSVGIYIGDDRGTFYCRPSDDLETFLSDLTAKLGELPRNP
jgi:hypothetical protein